MVTGDIVYSRGRISEYATRFFPVYNADDASPGQGRRCSGPPSRLATRRGNHDIATRDLGTVPDGTSPISSPGRSP